MIRSLLLAGSIAVVLTQATASLCLLAQEYQYNLQGEALVQTIRCRGEFGYRRKCSPAALAKFERNVTSHSVTLED